MEWTKIYTWLGQNWYVPEPKLICIKKKKIIGMKGGKFRLHPLDKRLTFDEFGCNGKPPHKYYFDGKMCDFSVTEFLSVFTGKFDKERKIREIVQNCGNRSRYYGMSAEEISDQWERAARSGTAVHNMIEKYYLDGILFTDKEHELYPDFEKFLEYDEAFRSSGARPLAPEYSVTAPVGKMRIAGTIDLLAEVDGGALLVDWKRSSNPSMRTRARLDNVVRVEYSNYSSESSGERWFVMPDGHSKSDVRWELQQSLGHKRFDLGRVTSVASPLRGKTFSTHLKNSLQLGVYSHILRGHYCRRGGGRLVPRTVARAENVYFCSTYDSYHCVRALDLSGEVAEMFKIFEMGALK